MEMMSLWKILVVLIVVALLGWGVYNLVQEKNSLGREAGELSEVLKSLEEENRTLTSKIEYFQNPENLLKEVKSQFNYREEGEGLIIIVPNVTNTSQ